MRDLAAADVARLHELIDQYPFKSYRNHRWLSRDRQTAVLQAEIERALGDPRTIARISVDADVIALARLLTWDSEFFGVSMGRVDLLLRAPGIDRDRVDATMHDLLGCLLEAGVRHVTLKADAADHSLIHAAEHAGFRLMDAIVTYISHPKRKPPRAVKEVGVIRPFRAADADQVLAITREAYAGYQGRFQLDVHLPRARSDEFYLEWARKCCSGDMADRIFVAEDTNGDLVGWASVKTAELASTVGGAPISVGSLGACRINAMGAYAGLICAAAIENHENGVLTEAMTQNSNFAMVRILESVGALYARAEYTLHAWLG
jgi:hypothetical protein